MGIASKCFEILENKPHNYDLHSNSTHPGGEPPTGHLPGGYPGNDPLIPTEDDDEDDDADEDDDDMDTAGPATADDEDTEDDTDDDPHDDSDDDAYSEGEDRRAPRLRLREILFYDDKVAIFKARHGRL